PGSGRGIAEIDIVPRRQLQLVGTGFELRLQQQLLPFQRNDLPFGLHYLASHGMNLQVQHEIERGADRQHGDPAYTAKAALRSHAASLAGAAVRVAERKVAERARGLRRISASDGRTA